LKSENLSVKENFVNRQTLVLFGQCFTQGIAHVFYLSVPFRGKAE